MMNTAGWQLDFVLPNLELPENDPAGSDEHAGRWPSGIDLGSKFIAIVPHRDPRLIEIRTRSPQACKLLDAFRTVDRRKYEPAAIIVRIDAPEPIRHDMECLIAFRNSVTFAFVLRARAAIAGGMEQAEPTWSDTFELHPTVVGERGHLVTRSPALLSVFSADAGYLATHSPHISPTGRQLYADHYVYRALSLMWTRRFIEGEKSILTTALFRALEVAFLAASVGSKNQGSLSDYGTQLSLWVSALEILAWPQKQHANLPAVVALLEQFEWASERLSQKSYTLSHKGTSLSLNAVQYAYALMYKARNAFLHGNPISAETLLPANLSKSLSLPQIASTVFRTALVAYLVPEVPRADFGAEELSYEFINNHTYAGALKAGFGLDRKAVADA